MATTAQQPTQAITTSQNKVKILEIIKRDAFKEQLAAALVKRVDEEFFMRTVIANLNHDNKLLSCTPLSVAASVLMLAEAGLAPEHWKGHAYLIPRKNQCTPLIGYKGYIHLAYRCPKVKRVDAQIVYEGDFFDCDLGSGQPPVHKMWVKPTPDAPRRGELVAAYAVCELDTGATLVDVMLREDIDKIRKRSAAADSGPWVTDYAEMARKSPLRRLSKRIPDAELQRVASMEELTEFGKTTATLDDKGTITIEQVDEPEQSGDEPTPPQRAGEAEPGPAVTPKQLGMFYSMAREFKWPEEKAGEKGKPDFVSLKAAVKETFGISEIEQFPQAKFNDLIALIKAGPNPHGADLFPEGRK